MVHKQKVELKNRRIELQENKLIITLKNSEEAKEVFNNILKGSVTTLYK